MLFRSSHLPSPLHDVHDADRNADSQSAVHRLLDSARMPHSQGSIRHLLVDGEVLHEESAVHDLHDDHPDLHTQSAVHGLQASSVHPNGDSHSLCASPSAGQAELLRAAHRLPPSSVHGLHSGLSAAVPDLHGRSTGSKLRDEVTSSGGMCDRFVATTAIVASLRSSRRRCPVRRTRR